MQVDRAAFLPSVAELAGRDWQQGTRLLELHRRLQDRSVPQCTGVSKMMLYEQFLICVVRLLKE